MLSGDDAVVLQAQGDRFVEAIEAYRTAHGNYPTTFGDAGITPADTATKFGPWIYMHSGTDPSFEISVGDYGRNNFALWWNSSHPHWYLDQ